MNNAFVITVKIAKNTSKIIIMVLAVTIRTVGTDTKYVAIPQSPTSTRLEFESNAGISILVINDDDQSCFELEMFSLVVFPRILFMRRVQLSPNKMCSGG